MCFVVFRFFLFSLFAVAIVTLVSASNNYQKERQFRAIEEKEKERCALKRGGVEMEAIADDVTIPCY